ncbi:MAG: hypothetical protein G01um101417_370 [Parcubacteria group bacterium Gr01-1014_17]|nr:MAG: hypothetical protein G01um101417_370 [Parcubacteria group bacterium Gr01-1014_17]
MSETLTPKFLTKQLAEKAIHYFINGIFSANIPFKRKACCIVVLVPAMEVGHETTDMDYPNFPTKAHFLCEYQLLKDKWTGDYDQIARCKALQLWHGRNDDGTSIKPHLLFPNDTVYWGGVKRHGIVVACSGVQPWFDKMLSGMIADLLVGLAHNEWVTSKDAESKVDFLT